jgi:pimeloyl-ACP methyl ester carboxylesterase
MNPSQAPRFLYLQAGFAPMLASFHPADGPRRKRAVLLCPPFGWEDMCSYRSRRDWAERLARAGFPALRFDFPGSGDSGGDPTDASQLDTWTRAAACAARWLKQTSGADVVVGIGIGLGGLVACRAALAGAPLDELVLWHVPARGRALVRELRAFSAMEIAYVPDAEREHAKPHPDPDPGDAEPSPLEAGALVANGYLLSPETLAALQQLDLAEHAGQSRAPRRALLLGRDGLKADERLREALARGATNVTVADGPGYGAMTVEPQEARAPLAVFELVDSWLLDGEQETQDDTGALALSSAEDAIDEREELRLSIAGVELRERPLRIEAPDGPLFGILAEPLGERAKLCAVLINAGAQRRTGPNRMWVEIARRWAARGVPTLRFDLAGIGDSDGDTAALEYVSTIYAQTYGRQALAALDALAARGLPERFLVLGLCAGGYWSLHTALADTRVTSVVMLNPRSLIWDERIYGKRRVRELRERVLLASTWRKALHGELNMARHVETARALAGRTARSPRGLRRASAAAPARDVAHATSAALPQGVDRTTALAGIFDTLSARDQRLLLLFTGAEPLHEELTGRGLIDERDRWPNLTLAIRGTGADTHTLTPLRLQREVHELVDEALGSELRRAGEGARP